MVLANLKRYRNSLFEPYNLKHQKDSLMSPSKPIQSDASIRKFGRGLCHVSSSLQLRDRHAVERLQPLRSSAGKRKLLTSADGPPHDGPHLFVVECAH